MIQLLLAYQSQIWYYKTYEKVYKKSIFNNIYFDCDVCTLFLFWCFYKTN